MTPRQVIDKFIGYIEAQEFAQAYNMLADDGTYTVIGKTKCSRTYHGLKDLTENLLPFFAGFKQAPALKFQSPIVDGNRVAVFGGGPPVEAKYGIYEQPYFGYSIEIRGDKIQHLIEFLDTVALETALFGKRLVD